MGFQLSREAPVSCVFAEDLDDGMTTFTNDVEVALQPYKENNGLTYPMEAHFAVAPA